MSKNDERVAKYLAAFGTEQGQWVLQDLEKRFTNHSGMGDGNADGMTRAMLLASQRGQSELIHYIKRQLDKGEK